MYPYNFGRMFQQCDRYPAASHFPLSLFRMIFVKFILLSFFSDCIGLKICENGLFCVSNRDCQIGNHCKEFVYGKSKSTRCVPHEDLGDTYYCSLSQKSCESKKIIFKLFFMHFNLFKWSHSLLLGRVWYYQQTMQPSSPSQLLLTIAVHDVKVINVFEVP